MFDQKAGIEAIYKLYPRKEGKAEGCNKLKKLLKSQEDFDQILLAVENYIKVIAHERRERKHTLLFSTFINSRWHDYVDVSEILPTKKSLDFV